MGGESCCALGPREIGERMLCEKVGKPIRRREVVRHYQDVFEVSARRACRAMHCPAGDCEAICREEA